MRYTTGRTDDGELYDLRDPLQDRLKPGPAEAVSAEGIMARVLDLPGFVPDALARNDAWRRAVEQDVAAMLKHGMAQKISEASRNT
jgi:mannitol-1-phosphate/altronate dehydrogenase